MGGRYMYGDVANKTINSLDLFTSTICVHSAYTLPHDYEYS